ncbi:MAG: ABC transporter ATP-binding protein [Cypionkella sp.]|jgi:oligopeptide/dipeptide ABC transporter ATP-binding protein|nr:ABC transporter ATP-binding protein [Cypionkella sp.]
MALIEAVNLGIDFTVGPPWARRRLRALQEVSMTIEPGEIIGVVGESGSGKSTFGNLCIGRTRPTMGQLLYRGRPLIDVPRRERAGRFAAVLQHPKWSLNPMLKVQTSVAEPLRIAGSAGTAAELRQKVGAMLELVGLPGSFQDRHPHELSGGQRQRVSIARALITQPEFVLFDEAVSALDVSVQAQILNLIKDLQAKVGFSAIFISHDLAATRYVASRIAVLYAGRMVEDARSEVFYGLAAHPYARGLQFASGLIDDESMELRLGQIDLDAKGCPLAERCPIALPQCRNKVPLMQDTDRHRVSCHAAETKSA